MKRFTQLMLVGCAAVCLLASGAAAVTKGHAWLDESLGTVVLAGCTVNFSADPAWNMGTYQGAGYNTLWSASKSEGFWDTAEQYKVPWFVVGKLDWTEDYALASAYMGGFCRYDEPDALKMQGTGSLGGPTARGLNFINLLGTDNPTTLWGDASNPTYTYPEYVQDMLSYDVDLLMYDHYPFRETISPLQYWLDDKFYARMADIRDGALSPAGGGMPYWKYLQAFRKINDQAEPTRSQYRLELFDGLAYGFTGFVHFWYKLPTDASPHIGLILDGSGNPSAYHYPEIAALTGEAAKLGKSMIYLSSTDVRYVKGQGTVTLPDGTVSWDDGGNPLSGTDPYQTNLQVVGAAGTDDFVVGYFEDSGGELYFMPVNQHHDANQAVDCTETVVIDFDFAATGITQLLRLNRTTGAVETIDTGHPSFTHTGGTTYQLSLTIEGGTGDLYKYDNATAFALAPEQMALQMVEVASSPDAPAGYTTYDFVANVGTALATMELVLDTDASDGIYQDGAGGNVEPDPSLFGADPSLEFDTYVTTGDFSPGANIISAAEDILPGSSMLFDGQYLNLSWAPAGGDDLGPGQIQVARVTLKDSATVSWTLMGWQSDIRFDDVTISGSRDVLLPGDVNGDGVIGPDDLTDIINNWGLSGATRSQGDLNGNGVVDGPDYTEVLSFWAPAEPPELTPEPATVGLLVLAGGLAVCRRRR